jgi:ferredoxin-NADP reductase/nitrite reductase/ring-hydroxylating ferredoxin subunit
MGRHVVARVDEIPEGGRLIVDVSGRSIGIFNVGGRFYALLNRCPHQGAKLCRGSIIGRIEADKPGQLQYDGTRKMIQCPWHGWEYDIETGQSFFDSAVRPYPVGVEDGATVSSGDAAPLAGTAVLSVGTSAPTLQEGPFMAETFPVAVDDDYLVLTLPRGGRTRSTAFRGGAAARTVGGAEPALRLTVAGHAAAADGVAALTLAAPDGAALPEWAPGAHVELVLRDDLVRQFSLCGPPAAATWRVGVLREPDGRGGSALVHDELRVGDTVEVVGPRNNFPFVAAERYRFVAGGIGITPLLPMIAAADAAGADWSLLYGGRSRTSMAFLDELAAYGDRVTVHPEDEQGLLPLADYLAIPEDRDTLAYCCGPEALIAAVEARCESWPAGTLHVERFRPKPGALDGPSTAFEVVLEDSGMTLAVGPDQSIIDALESAGVEVPSSCREGTCGTCETEVLDGAIDHRDSFLTPEEQASGEVMMICCSRAAAGSELVLGL